MSTQRVTSRQLNPGIILSVAFSMLTVIGLPAVAGAATDNTIVSSVVASVLTLDSDTQVDVDVTPTSTGAQTVSADTVDVGSNDPDGYNLTLQDVNADTNLVSGGNNIAASAGTQAAPVDLVANTWGYRVDDGGAEITSGFLAGPTSTQTSQAIGSVSYLFAGVPANGSANTIRTVNAPGSTTLSVWYSVAADLGQAAGTYTDTVIYTALGN